MSEITYSDGIITVESGGESVTVVGQDSVIEVVDSQSTIDVLFPGPIEVLTEGVQGPPGPPGVQGPDGAGKTSKRFDWGDASPRPITTIAAGRTVLAVTVYLIEAFDAAGSSLSVGPAGDPAQLLAAGDVSAVGSVSTTPSVEYATDTPLFLTITLGGGNAAGSGYVVIEVNNDEVTP